MQQRLADDCPRAGMCGDNATLGFRGLHLPLRRLPAVYLSEDGCFCSQVTLVLCKQDISVPSIDMWLARQRVV